MNSRFRDLLVKAISGDHDSVEAILEMYMPVINKNSRIGGQLDEDCRQYIMMRIAINISKFIV